MYKIKIQPKYKTYSSTGRMNIEVPRTTRLSVVDKNGTIVAHIPDYLPDGDKIGNAIANCLNKSSK
jgi:hypothetical protein